MKTIVCLVCLAALVPFLAPPLQAQVSSSYDLPAEPPPQATSGYDGGFFVGSPDGDYKLKIGARVDPMFYWQSSPVPDDPDTAAINESLSEATFRLRRAQIWINPVFKNFSIYAMLSHSTDLDRDAGAQSTTWIANGTFSFNKNVSLEAGYDGPAYDFTSLFSSSNMTMVDYPIVMTQKDGEAPVWNMVGAKTITRPSFGLPNQLGLFFATNFLNNRLNFYASIGNGTESIDKVAMNKRLTYVGRVSYVILGENPYGDMSDYKYSETPTLAVGAGGAFESDPGYGDDGSGTTPPTLVKMYNWRADAACDILFRYRGFSLNLAGYAARLKVGPGAVWEAGEKYLDDMGYLATVAMFVIPKKLEVQGWGAQIFREGPDNNVYEFGGGLNWYIFGPNVKLQIDASRLIDYEDIRGSNHGRTNRVRAKLQMLF